MSKLCVIIFSLFIGLYSPLAMAVHSFGIVTEIEGQLRQSETQKNKSAFQNFFTIEQNWSNDNSKFLGQIRIFEYYHSDSPTPDIIHEIYPVEFNFEKNIKNQRITIGYQSIFLTEGFNLIDSEIFHPKNNQISIFKSPDKRYYTSPGLSYKYFGSKVNLQLATLKAERTERLSLEQKAFLLNSVPYFIEPDYRKNSVDLDSLLKLSGAVGVVDWSFYYSRTFEKNPTFQYDTLKNKFVTLSAAFNTYGVGFAGLAGASVIRFDFQKSLKRNYIDSNNQQIKTDQNNFNFSLDRSLGDNLRGNIGWGRSLLDEDFDIPVREKEINDLFMNLNYKFNAQNNFDISFFERLGMQTSALQVMFNTKILGSIEVNYGVEYFWTGEKSKLKFLGDQDRLFIAFKATTF